MQEISFNDMTVAEEFEFNGLILVDIGTQLGFTVDYFILFSSGFFFIKKTSYLKKFKKLGTNK